MNARAIALLLSLAAPSVFAAGPKAAPVFRHRTPRTALRGVAAAALAGREIAGIEN